MERQVRRMLDIEQRFEQVVRREGKSVSEFRQMVQENSKIQTEIKVRVVGLTVVIRPYPIYPIRSTMVPSSHLPLFCLESKKANAAKELLDLFSVIMSTDRNEDNEVSSSEAQEFILRVRAFAGRRGKSVDEDLILDAFKHSMSNPSSSHCTASMFNIVQTALSDDLKQPPDDEEKQEMNSATDDHQPKEEVVEDGFVKLHRIPRVAPTGLVLSDSKDDEGNPVHPITVEDLMTRGAMSSDALLPAFNDTHAHLSIADSDGTESMEEGTDIVSMILKSFSSLRST
jgi:hypothetical protein